MQIDRRQFMGSISSLAILATAKDAQAGFPDGVSPTGNLQINTYNLQRGNAFPFVNMFLANDRPWTPNGFNAGVDGYTYLDSTNYPTSMPPRGGGFDTYLAVYLPPLTETTGNYTLSWTGAGNVNVSLLYPGFTLSVTGTNPKLLTIARDTANYAAWDSAHQYNGGYDQISSFVTRGGNYYFVNNPSLNKDPLTDNGCYWLKVTTGFQVNLKISISSTPVAAIQLYRTSLGVPSPTNMFDPQLLKVYGGYGIIRFTQWGSIINSPISSWATRPQSGTYSWWGNEINTQWYVGTFPPPTKNALVAPRDPPGYVSGGLVDKMQFHAYWPSAANMSTSAITAISNANPCQITTSSAHGFSTNDKVFFNENEIVSTVPTVANWSNGTTYDKGAIVNIASGVGAGPQGVYMSLVSGNVGVYPGSDVTKWIYFAGNPANAASCSLDKILGVGGPNAYTITVVDSTKFTIALDSTTWPIYSSGGHVSSQVTLSTPSLGPKRVIYAACSEMAPSYINTQTNNIWIFTYDAEFDAFLAQGFNSCQYGWPLEQQVALCNKLNCNGWFNIPHMADDTFVTNMATYIRDNLNSNLVAYYELSNEVWNGFFSETPYADAKAKLYAKNGLHGWTAGPLPSYPISATGYYNWFWYGWRFYTSMSIVKTVYAGKLNQCHCTLAHQAAAGTAIGGFLDYTLSGNTSQKSGVWL